MIRIQHQARPALSGETFPTYNPATGELLAELPRGRREDVDLAVRAARGAFDRWARIDPYERERLLRRVAELIVQHNDELAAIESRDTGKPLVNARTIDVPRTADTFFYFAGWPTKLTGRTFPVRGPFATSTLREPLGVVGAIVPWNFPLLIAARKVAAAGGSEGASFSPLFVPCVGPFIALGTADTDAEATSRQQRPQK